MVLATLCTNLTPFLGKNIWIVIQTELNDAINDYAQSALLFGYILVTNDQQAITNSQMHL